MKRIAILVNKDFEYKGFIEGLRDTVEVHAGTNGRDAECRFQNIRADIYCIQHLFGENENSSNSEVKYGYLQKLFKSNEFRINDVDAVLSVSTSESTPEFQGTDGDKSLNGCVIVGNRFFISDQRDKDKTTESNLDIGSEKSNHSEFYLEGTVHENLFDRINVTNMKLKQAPINSSSDLKCMACEGVACVSVVNVMDYSCYTKADEAAYGEFWTKPYSQHTMPIGIETTHGVVVKAFHSVIDEINIKREIPVTFISPIVDRYLKFDEDVDGKEGKQNFICSYNGGVATGHVLKILNDMEG